MVKLVSLSNDVYEKLKKMKNSSESFSHFIRKKITSPTKRSILDLAGSIKDSSFEDAMEIVLSKRKIKSKRVVRFG